MDVKECTVYNDTLQDHLGIFISCDMKICSSKKKLFPENTLPVKNECFNYYPEIVILLLEIMKIKINPLILYVYIIYWN